MAVRKKIDSNETELSYAEEASIGVLPVTPIWIPLEPNSYDDFGGELTLLARNPINQSRQRKKGAITDLEASGGFNQDFTLKNTPDMLQGFMFANFREKLNDEPSAVTATGYVADVTDWAAGQALFASGFSNAANNGLKTVTGATGGEIKVSGLVVEASPPAGASVALVGIAAGAGDLDVNAAGAFPTITSTATDWTDYGLSAGEWIYVGGDAVGTKFTNAANNGFKRIRSVAAGVLTIDQSTDAMVTEASTGETVQIFLGRFLKNELGADIIRRSYQLERKLGAPETTMLANLQSEYLIGAVPSELTLTLETADKINLDMSFVALDNEQRDATTGLKSGTRITIEEADAFNTSSDVKFSRLYVHSGTENASSLFAYLTDLTISINNNLSPNKAIAVLGAFDITAGTFEVSGEATAYFADVAAVDAVRENADVGLYLILAKAN